MMLIVFFVLFFLLFCFFLLVAFFPFTIHPWSLITIFGHFTFQLRYLQTKVAKRCLWLVVLSEDLKYQVFILQQKAGASSSVVSSETLKVLVVGILNPPQTLPRAPM